MTEMTFADRVVRIREVVATLRATGGPRLRERLSGVHNAWGPAAALVDTWLFLDLCQDATVLDGVEALIGPDIVLWDCELYLEAARYRDLLVHRREGRWWPVEPLAGVVTVIPVTVPPLSRQAAVTAIMPAILDGFDAATALLVIRHMPATSRYVREPRFPANWRAMEERPLINLTTRPLWLLRGNDRANNDFVTGFAVTAPRWAGPNGGEN